MTPSNYLTLEEVKAYAPNNELSTSTIWDGLVTTLCGTLSRAFDRFTFRDPGAYAVTGTSVLLFDGVPDTATDYRQYLDIGEMADTPTLVTINGVSVPSNDYWPEPYNALSSYRPYTHLYMRPDGTTQRWGAKKRSIAVTSYFGYSKTVPPDVLEALLLFTLRFVRKAQQNYMETGVLLDSGQVMVTAKRDEDLADLILHYKRSRYPGGSVSATGGLSG